MSLRTTVARLLDEAPQYDDKARELRRQAGELALPRSEGPRGWHKVIGDRRTAELLIELGTRGA